MIQSLIEPNIEYKENKDILKHDIGYKAPYFEVELFKNTYGNIALGKLQEQKNGIIYFPVYYIEDGIATEQIGIYEINKEEYKNNQDSEGDLDIQNLPDPLPIYNSTFTKDYLYEKQLKDANIRETQKILEQTTPTELDEMISYSPLDTDSWIQKYMKNPRYSLFDVESNGDCFFATIRDAFKTINIEKSVNDLRTIISDAATDETFKDYNEIYLQYKNEFNKVKKALMKIKKKNESIKKQTNESSISRDEKLVLLDEIEELKKDYGIKYKEYKNLINVLGEWDWFKEIKNISDLKEAMLTSNYWADSWSINILEMKLKIKMIILSEENYLNGDTDNVMVCGNVVPDEIEQKNEFEPENYIMVSHTGNHYKLIKYNNNAIFNFENIPQIIKDLIVNKCMEQNSGIFSFISGFKKLKKQYGGGKNKNKQSFISSDFDEKCVLQFYDKSTDVPPGKGPNEKIPTNNTNIFKELNNIKDWRKILSNQYATTNPLNIDGKKWKTVTHYYNSQKFINENPKFSDLFSLDSKNEISENVKMAIAAGGKSGKYKKKIIRDKSINIDSNFSNNKNKILYKSLLEKYKQDDLSKRVLLATNNAKLQEFKKGGPPEVAYNIMRIRDIINE